MNGRNCNDDLFGNRGRSVKFDGDHVDINDLFGALFGSKRTNTPSRFGQGVECSETDSEIVIEWDLPGILPKDINVQIEGNVLTVKAERKGKRCSRRFMLSPTVSAMEIAARHENGVLILTLPKKAEAKPRTIPVIVSTST